MHALMQHQRLRAEILDEFLQPFEMRIERERDLEGGARLIEVAVAQADLAEAGHGREMARLELEGAGDVGQTSGSRFSMKASVARLFHASGQSG